jgi:diamine N-acetyltransferase
MNVQLRDITAENWRQVCKLQLDEPQNRYVAPNWYSILEANYGIEEATDTYSKAIYAGDDVVGYAMYIGMEPERQGYIVRLMTGKDHQGKGYGRAAMQQIIEQLRQQVYCDKILISFVPGNDIAQKLYEQLGFVDTGRVEDGELVFELKVK